MTNKEGQLLTTELCSRFQYGLICEMSEDGVTITDKLKLGGLNHFLDGTLKVKPYLRPISSLTEEEMDRLFEILNIDGNGNDGNEWIKINDIGILRLFTNTGRDFYEIAEALDYLHSIHIDYRGLIHKGLALEAPEGMYH